MARNDTHFVDSSGCFYREDPMKRKYPGNEITQTLVRHFRKKFKKMSLKATSKRDLKEQIHYLFDSIRWGGEDESFYEFQVLLIEWALKEVDMNVLFGLYWNPERAKKLLAQQKKEKKIYDKMISAKIYKKDELPE